MLTEKDGHQFKPTVSVGYLTIIWRMDRDPKLSQLSSCAASLGPEQMDVSARRLQVPNEDRAQMAFYLLFS